jgi:hypothetical protein
MNHVDLREVPRCYDLLFHKRRNRAQMIDEYHRLIGFSLEIAKFIDVNLQRA